MAREDFESTLIKQYTDCIEDLIVSSESIYRTQIDYEKLDFKVKAMIKAATVDGLSEQSIWDIIERKLPDYHKRLTDQRENKSRVIQLKLVA